MKKRTFADIAGLIIVLWLICSSCATAPRVQTESSPIEGKAAMEEKLEPVEIPAQQQEATGRTGPQELEEKWGVRVLGIRQSAGGYMLDFRYRIVDPEKAQPLMDRQFKPYLIHQESGAKFMVPSPPKVGPLRQTVRSGKPEAHRNYFILFTNPAKYVKPGNKVTVVIGDFRAEDLIVQ